MTAAAVAEVWERLRGFPEASTGANEVQKKFDFVEKLSYNNFVIKMKGE